MEQTDLKQSENGEQNKEKKPNCVGRFLAVAVLVVMLAAGWFLFWAYVSYNLRLSADVIRAGLVLLYILPCWIGGRVLRRCMQRYAVIYGAVLGAVFYTILLALTVTDSGAVQMTQTHVMNACICVLSGIVGIIRLKREVRGG